jgi:hypothetical protein
MKRVTGVTGVTGVAGVIGLMVLTAALLACGDDDDRTTIISPPAPSLPTVTCCEFSHPENCRDIPVARLQKMIRQGHACFDKGACFTGCP